MILGIEVGAVDGLAVGEAVGEELGDEEGLKLGAWLTDGGSVGAELG